MAYAKEAELFTDSRLHELCFVDRPWTRRSLQVWPLASGFWPRARHKRRWYGTAELLVSA